MICVLLVMGLFFYVVLWNSRNLWGWIWISFELSDRDYASLEQKLRILEIPTKSKPRINWVSSVVSGRFILGLLCFRNAFLSNLCKHNKLFLENFLVFVSRAHAITQKRVIFIVLYWYQIKHYKMIHCAFILFTIHVISTKLFLALLSLLIKTLMILSALLVSFAGILTVAERCLALDVVTKNSSSEKVKSLFYVGRVTELLFSFITSTFSIFQKILQLSYKTTLLSCQQS